MLNFIMTQAILRGDAVIFIDPKGSDRMYKAFCRACEKADRGKPLRFHPGNRSKTDGIRFDVTAVFQYRYADCHSRDVGRTRVKTTS